jgi:hypothetical protein
MLPIAAPAVMLVHRDMLVLLVCANKNDAGWQIV